MLIEYIERLRKEPKEVRQRAVVTWTIVLVSAIALCYVILRVYLAVGVGTDTGASTTAPYSDR